MNSCAWAVVALALGISGEALGEELAPDVDVPLTLPTSAEAPRLSSTATPEFASSTAATALPASPLDGSPTRLEASATRETWEPRSATCLDAPLPAADASWSLLPLSERSVSMPLAGGVASSENTIGRVLPSPVPVPARAAPAPGPAQVPAGLDILREAQGLLTGRSVIDAAITSSR